MINKEVDVVVIGSGCAGMAAAYTVAEQGASVLIFEKSGKIGGMATGGNGVFAVETNLQSYAQSALTRKSVYDEFMAYTHYKADPVLVSKYISKTADTLQWLKGFGITFSGVVGYFKGAHLVWHQRDDDAPMITPAIYKACQDMGFDVQCYLCSSAKKILKNENGEVCGVLAQMDNGEEVMARCEYVVIATGGFGANAEMVKEYTGLIKGHDYFPFAFPEVQGDGLKMAWEAGAGKSDIFFDAFVSMTGDYAAGPGGCPPNLGIFRQPSLMVNADGRRFVNEEIMRNPSFAGNAVHQQRGGSAFMIFDDTLCGYYENNDWDFQLSGLMYKRSSNTEAVIRSMIDGTYEPAPMGGPPETPDYAAWPGVTTGADPRTAPQPVGGPEYAPSNDVFIADSVQELAEKLGVSADALLKTIEAYNECCRTGRDNYFFKDPKYLRPLTGRRFYACRFALSGYGTLGGIKIDSDARVLTGEGEAIPGLYAAGNDANALYAGTYPFTFSGNTSSFCYNVGRIAGEHICSCMHGKE